MNSKKPPLWLFKTVKFTAHLIESGSAKLIEIRQVKFQCHFMKPFVYATIITNVPSQIERSNLTTNKMLNA